jgi:hypothetical protein
MDSRPMIEGCTTIIQWSQAAGFLLYFGTKLFCCCNGLEGLEVLPSNKPKTQLMDYGGA